MDRFTVLPGWDDIKLFINKHPKSLENYLSEGWTTEQIVNMMIWRADGTHLHAINHKCYAYFKEQKDFKEIASKAPMVIALSKLYHASAKGYNSNLTEHEVLA